MKIRVFTSAGLGILLLSVPCFSANGVDIQEFLNRASQHPFSGEMTGFTIGTDGTAVPTEGSLRGGYFFKKKSETQWEGGYGLCGELNGKQTCTDGVLSYEIQGSDLFENIVRDVPALVIQASATTLTYQIKKLVMNRSVSSIVSMHLSPEGAFSRQELTTVNGVLVRMSIFNGGRN